MMGGRRGLLALSLILGGCMDSCSCEGCGQGGAPEHSGLQPSGGPATVEQPAVRGDGGMVRSPPNFEPAPRSELSDQLLLIQRKNAWSQTHGEPVPPEALSVVLADKLGDYSAEGPVRPGAERVHRKPVTSRERSYRDGRFQLRISITDSSQAPGMREMVRRYLGSVGTPRTGRLHGLLVRGYPAITSFQTASNTSSATLVVANRFVIQVKAQPSDHPKRAQRALELMDWSSLAPKQAPAL